MKKRLGRSMAATAAGALALTTLVAPAAVAQDDGDYEVLVVGETLGFRHSSIDDATRAIIALGEEHGFSVDVWDQPNDSGGWWGPGSPGQPELTLDSTPFTSEEDLAKYATIVFVSPVDNTNSQDPEVPRLLDDGELEAFQGYIRNGGGFAGVHAATDTMHSVPWYSELTGGGARFISHPQNQTATVWVEDPTHPSTDDLPLEWERYDEWYNFTQNPRDAVHVLMNLDETTYDAGDNAMGDHPIAWCQNFEGGSSWYTAGGHTDESFSDALFLEHLLGGIEWSAGVAGDAGDCTTFDEVYDVLDDLADPNPRNGVAAVLMNRKREAAQDASEAGDHDEAAHLLRTAEEIGQVLPANEELGDHAAVLLAGLAERQEAFAAQD